MKHRINAETFLDKKKKATQEKITIQLVEINQKVQVKGGKLKKYQLIQDKTAYSKNKTKENSTNQLGEMIRTHTNNRMREKLNNFGVKYGNQENIKKPNG